MLICDTASLGLRQEWFFSWIMVYSRLTLQIRECLDFPGGACLASYVDWYGSPYRYFSRGMVLWDMFGYIYSMRGGGGSEYLHAVVDVAVELGPVSEGV